MTSVSYIGRFAPSPTGPLHLGSLLTALASYLDARANNGRWLVRMEDLDPPREQPGATTDILQTLEHYGLCWDGDVWFQSQRHEIYEAAVQQLLQRHQAFYCTCSRKDLQLLSASAYPGTCHGHFQQPDKPFSVRIQVEDKTIAFDDALQGHCEFNLQVEGGDFIIKRKDKLYAYHLAVVIDDAAQQITDIVRGSDLLDSTPRHIVLQQLLELPTPAYAHLPVLVNEQGQKLSKQTFAASIPKADPVPRLYECLCALGQKPPPELVQTSRDELLDWAVKHWSLARVPRQMAQSATAFSLHRPSS